MLAALLSPFLFFHQDLYRADITYNIEPAGRYIHDTFLKTGHCPTWNPYILGGVPQIVVCWPIDYWPGRLVLPLSGELAGGLIYFFHFLLMGVGGFLWQFARGNKDEQTHFFSCAFFGTALMLCGYFGGSSINPMLLVAFSWTPLALLCIDKIIQSRGLKWIAFLALCVGMQVSAGRPEVVAGALLLYLVYSFFEIALNHAKLDATVVFRLFAGAVLGVAFGAADYLPLMEMTRYNPPVGGFDKLGAGFWSAGPFDFLTMLVSQPLGDLSMTRFSIYPTYPGVMPYITSYFLGAPVLTLAAFGFLQKSWRQRWLWLGVMVLSICLAAGDFGGLFGYISALFHKRVIFRYPVKFGIFCCLSIAVAAAEGWRAAFAGEKRVKSLMLPFAVWGSLVGVAIALYLRPAVSIQILRHLACAWSLGVDNVTVSLLKQAAPGFALQCLLAGVSGLIGLLLIFWGTKQEKSLPSQSLLLVLVALLLVVDNARNLWHTVDGSFFDKHSDVATKLVTVANQSGNAEFRVLSLLDDPLPVPSSLSAAGDRDAAFMAYARRVLRSNTNMDEKVRLINGMPIIPTWRSFFLSTGLLPRSSQQPNVSHPAGKSDLPLFRWCQGTSTRFVLTSAKEQKEDGHWEDVPRLDPNLFVLEEESSELNLRIYSVPNPRPRVSLVFRSVEIAERENALTAINRCDVTGWDPNRVVLITFSERPDASLHKPLSDVELNSLQEVLASAPAAVSSGGEAKIVKEENDALTVDVNTSMAATLIITDSYCPGWHALDNGKPTDILIADGLERAVRVGPGRHTIEFTYKPESYLLGLQINHATTVLLVLLLLLDLRRSRTQK